MKLTEKEVRYVADLANLRLGDDEIHRMTAELGSILVEQAELVVLQVAHPADTIDRLEGTEGPCRRSPGGAMVEAEQQVLGITHAEIGAYLLGLWGLPYPIVEAVANHHRPERVESSGFGVLSAVYVADRLIHEAASPRSGAQTTESDLDMAHLEKQGVAGRVPEWREMAQQELKSGARGLVSAMR